MAYLVRVMTVLALIAMPLQPAHAQSLGARAVTDFIRPAYETLAIAARANSDDLASLCADPSEANLEAAFDSYAELVEAWSSVEIVRFGPIVADNRLERILFWPDRRGIGLRQIQGLLAEKDSDVLDLENLRQQSVALQGLGTLEYILYGTGAEELATTPGTYRCALGETVARTIAVIAEAVSAEWADPDGIAAHLAEPEPDYPDYRTDDEVLREFVGVLVHGLEMIRDTRLQTLIATDDTPANPRAAIFRRSELTVESIAANVAGLHLFLVASGIVETLPDDRQWIAEALAFEAANFADTAIEIRSMPLERAVNDPDAAGKLAYLEILTGSLQDIVVDELSPALGLSAGFSSLDGD